MADVSTLGLAVDSSGVRRATDDLAKFSAGGKLSEQSAKNLEEALTSASAKGTAFGVVIGQAIGQIGSLASGFVELALSAGDYRDIADQIGSKDAAGFASLRTSADVAGVSMAKLATDSVRLSTNLAKVDDESRGAGKALEAIGLTVEQIKGLAPDEQFRTIAKALDQYADSGSKAAVATALFRDPEALKFLKELGQETEKVNYLTEEQITRADDFADAAKRSQSQIKQMAQALGTEVLPAISAFLGAIKETAAEIAGLTGESKKLGANTGVSDFAEGAAKSLAFLIDAGDGVVRTFQVLGKTIGGYAAVSGALLTGNWEQAKRIGQEFRADVDGVLERQTFSEKLAKQFEANRAKGGGATATGKSDIAYSAIKDKTTATKELADGYDALMKRIREKTTVDQAELDIGRKLTESERFQISVYAEVEKNFDKLSIAKLLAIDEATQLAIAVGKEREAFEADAKWTKEAGDQNASYVETLMKQRDALEDRRKSAELDLQEFGLTHEALQGLEVARLRDAAAALEQKAAQADTAYLEDNARLYREQADQLNRTADARARLAGKEAREHNDPLTGAQRSVEDYLDGVKRAGDATKQAVTSALNGLEDVTVAVLSGKGGKDAARQWVDGIISEIVRLSIVKPLLASIMGESKGGSGGGWLSALGGIASAYFGGGSGMATNNTGTYLPTAGGRAAGGPVSAGKNYVVGENGPEILRMGNKAGSITPNEALGGSRAVTVNVTNNGQAVQAKSSQRETDQGTIIDLVLDAVAADISGGGKSHDAIQKRFGMNPGGSTPRY